MAETMKEWALKYADIGLAVFPLKPKDKRPATENGCKAATTDSRQIETWWSRWPNANIGIATGSVSGGLVVIDLDVDKDKGINGYESLAIWQKENGELPETWTSITGRGGYHYIYIDGATNRNRAGLYDGIDIRGEGGYIVAPPSIHPNGRQYEWEQGPGDCEIAKADNRVMNFLMGPVPENWEKQSFQEPEMIPAGERTSTMIRLIGSLKAKGLDDEAIKAAARAENAKKWVPPLTDQELEKTVFTALKRGWRAEKPYTGNFVGGDEILYLDSFEGFEGFEGADTTKLPLFKMELLPHIVAGFSMALMESLQVSSGMVAPAIVTVGSLGVQKKYCIHPHTDWYEPGNLYMAIVAEASERKSPTMKEIMKPVYEYEKEENEKIAPDIAIYETNRKILEGKIASITKNLTSSSQKKDSEKYLDMGDLTDMQQELNELEEVAPIRLVVDDVTMEVLGKLMEQNNERIGIFSTEGGIFNILAGRYSDKTIIDLILKAYTGDRYAQDRMTRRGQALDHPLITMLLYVQPIVIKEIMENSEFVGRGLNARFLYSIPPSTIGERSYRVKKISDFDRADYSDVIQRLFAIPVPNKPKVIELDEDADRLAEVFFYEIESDMKTCSPEFKAWLGKLHGTTMRIALVLHCFEYVEQSEYHKISGQTMTNAIEMGRYFRAHAEAAFDIMGLMDPPEVRDAKYIMKRIDSTGLMEMKLRDLQQMCKDKKGMEKREGMIPGLRCLIEHGYIRVQKSYLTSQNPQNPQKGGRPSEILYVNPEYIKWKEQQKC